MGSRKDLKTKGFLTVCFDHHLGWRLPEQVDGLVSAWSLDRFLMEKLTRVAQS